MDSIYHYARSSGAFDYRDGQVCSTLFGQVVNGRHAECFLFLSREQQIMDMEKEQLNVLTGAAAAPKL